MAGRIQAAFVFGSVAKGGDTAASDIVVLVIADGLDYADLFAALQSAEARLARPVTPTLVTPSDWRRMREQGNPFVVKIAAQPKIMLIGTEAELG